jgi:RimJ/RimL family protein N-acetyltransferase
MGSEIGQWSAEDREALAAYIGESPATVLFLHALRSGFGRVWVSGAPRHPRAVIIESALVPGEPRGFGEATEILALLAQVDDWFCIELTQANAELAAAEFARRWGLAKRVIDVQHVLETATSVTPHPAVRPLSTADLNRLTVDPDGGWPGRDIAVPAVELGRVVAAIDGESIIGHAGSFAAGRKYADVGVHVAKTHRRRGLATACAAGACEAVRADGLTPVWSCGADNHASLRVAAKLGFTEVERLVYLVRS